MFVLSGFADEISHDLEQQVETLTKLNIRCLELRGVSGKNVLELTDEEAAQVKSRLDEAGIRVSAIGSPIGKIDINDPFAPHLERCRRAIRMAKMMECQYVRIFSYFIPEGEEPEKYRDEVMGRMEAKTRAAEEEGVTLLHENEKRIYGEQPERCLDILDTVRSDHLKAIFDPANFIQAGRAPYEECWRLLKNRVVYFHIKDASRETGAVVPAGEGDGGIGRILAEVDASDREVFLSLEPHLKAAGPFDGFSGPDLFETAAKALREVMREQGLHEG